jgi:hypothetical protein
MTRVVLKLLRFVSRRTAELRNCLKYVVGGDFLHFCLIYDPTAGLSYLATWPAEVASFFDLTSS